MPRLYKFALILTLVIYKSNRQCNYCEGRNTMANGTTFCTENF